MNYSIIRTLLDNMDTSLHFCREVSCFITPKQGLITLTTNNSGGSVELPFFKIWEAMKKGEKNNYCVIVHTHPPNCAMMSGIDKSTVYGWCQALGIPIYFIIIANNVINCWLCKRDEKDKSIILRELIWSVETLAWELEFKLNFLKLFSHIMYGLSKSNDEIDEASELELKNNLSNQEIIFNESELNIWGYSK